MTAAWKVGAEGQPPARVRQIVLTNGTALFACLATLPYLAYYLSVGPEPFLPVVLVNVGFVLVYGGAFRLNARARFEAARNLVLAAVYAQLFVVTALIGTGAGVHLFYFPLAASIGMVLVERRERVVLALLLLAVALFLTCAFAFPSGDAVLHVPHHALRAMWVVSATGAIVAAVSFPYLFRLEIDRAHAALAESHRELERLSGLDAVTGIPNRRAFDAHLLREWSRAARDGTSVSLLVCDVDRFKEYNDRYGHPAGDRCLRGVADALRRAAARGGDLVARYGGEEFVVVLPSTREDGAAEIGERARAAVAALALPHEASDVAPFVSVSVGVASVWPEQPGDPHELLRRADDALYAAKLAGRNRVVGGGGVVGGYSRAAGVID